MPAEDKRAAYFLLSGGYHGRPLDAGVIKALIAAGYAVDIYAPELPDDDDAYPPSTRCFKVEYRIRWLQQHADPFLWRRYRLFLGTCDMPMAFAGALSAITGRRSVTVCDEIYIGGYEGSAKSYWRFLARTGMRRSRFTVITDPCREDLQKQYAGLSAAHRFIQFPCCFAENRFLYDKQYWKKALGIADDAFVMSISGYTAASSGGHWAVDLLDKMPSRYKILVQPGGSIDPLTHSLLRRLSHDGRTIYIAGRSGSFKEAMSMNLAADIGLVFYLSQKPQFQQMGVSSNKLCMYLQMGKPVIASRQKSFEFLEDYGAGVLVNGEDEIPAAIAEIENNYEKYSGAAIECFKKHIDPVSRLEKLREAFASL